jgi:hypothetical protein
MSRREVIILTDDIDGSDHDVRTVAFSLERNSYTIDLSALNRDRLAAALAPFMAVARRRTERGGNRIVRSESSAAANQSAFNRRVRTWSAQQGNPLAERGKVPQAAVDAYLATGLR